MRDPKGAAPALSLTPATRLPLADLRLRVVTPMFGGGVDPGQYELGNLIRPSAVRGHLRFWWRACNAGRFANLEELAREERRLWGSMAKRLKPTDADYGTFSAGGIGVRIDVTDEGRQDRKPDALHYVLWPFDEQTTTTPVTPERHGRTGVVFRLRLLTAPHVDTVDPDTGKPFATSEECRDAAEQALWAWIAFGGVGARTRRGCGTLYCVGNGPDSAVLRADAFQPGPKPNEWLMQRLTDLVPADSPAIRGVPALVDAAILIRTRAAIVPAWSSAIAPMRMFLQEEDVGRNPRPDPKREINPHDNRPGQSRWPEVAAARRIFNTGFGTDQSGHAYKVHSVVSDYGPQFPRADLGLPRAIKTASQPGALTVTVEAGRLGATRMASPIVLKALAVSETHAVPLVLRLTTPHPWSPGAPGIQIKDDPMRARALTPYPLNDAAHPPTWHWTQPPQTAGAASARDAFVAYVVELGWTRVK